MLTFQNLLFPTDLSARCVHFAPYVGGIARKFGSEITLLHTLDMHDPFGYGAASGTTVYGDCEAEVKKLHEKAFAEFGKDVFAGLATTRITRTGDSAACIIKYAEEHNTDVIFMPTHGRGVFRRLLLGSVTSKVLHDARIPVWTSAHSESADGNAAASRDIRCIICAVDLSPDAVRVVRAAAGLGASYGATVRLIHAVGAPETGDSSTSDECFRRFLFDLATDQLAARQREAGTHFETCIRHGTVAATVKEIAANTSADLVVIGRGRLQELLGRLKTNVAAIIRESPCPVLSV